MINKLLRFFNGRKPTLENTVPSSVNEELGYDQKFNVALEFSNSHGFSADSKVSNFEKIRVEELVQELANIIPGFIGKYSSMGFKEPIIRFGGDCGTVHFSIFQFIKQYYPDLPVNVTLGEVDYSTYTYFNFDKDKCEDWIENGSPEIFDCHTWLTVGDDLVIDVTIGTYVNTRIDSDKNSNIAKRIFGGIIFGEHGSFSHIPIIDFASKVPDKLDSLKYSPVVVGAESLHRLAPRQP
ncbi:hypothetical protein [Shewanella vaxholmensis]|uniref:Uncharacterized protein n=1 Tax=Shewanella vaxholmensis TaxID=3063535 RepID=A0ABU9UQ96_9GAMM